jgi:hypothetical protein
MVKQHDNSALGLNNSAAGDADEAQRKSLVNEAGNDYGSITLDGPKQAGVRAIEAISLSWTKWGLIVAYISYVF